MIQVPKDFHNPVHLLEKLKVKPETYWIHRGEKRALSLFHQMAERVPAYKAFLKKNNVTPNLVKTIQDFKQIPTIDKDTYLRSYSLESLCWDGALSKSRWVFSTTSGSTGEPYYFPRQDYQDWQYALTAELYLRNNFEIHKKSTLYVNSFAMGAWIGGLFTYQAVKLLAERGDYSLSTISPGIFKKETIQAIKNLGNKFDQVIIGGYPPFIKDIIDDGIAMGINWRDYNLGFIFSAEPFTEKFRDHIVEKTGLKNPYINTLNHYGTVDLGTMAHETPLSIMMRRLLERNMELKQLLLPEPYKQPTLAQYLPELFFFEEENSRLICSAFSGIPLVRYDLKDYGGIITLKTIEKKSSELGINIFQEGESLGINKLVWNLPMVYVYERLDFTVKLYGANIYSDTIRKALQEETLIEFLTGKFTMIVKFDNNHNQYLEINVELKAKVQKNVKLKKNIQNSIIKYLLLENSEYKSNYIQVKDKQIPSIVFWPYEHSLHFSPGGKQKWVKDA